MHSKITAFIFLLVFLQLSAKAGAQASEYAPATLFGLQLSEAQADGTVSGGQTASVSLLDEACTLLVSPGDASGVQLHYDCVKSGAGSLLLAEGRKYAFGDGGASVGFQGLSGDEPPVASLILIGTAGGSAWKVQEISPALQDSQQAPSVELLLQPGQVATASIGGVTCSVSWSVYGGAVVVFQSCGGAESSSALSPGEPADLSGYYLTFISATETNVMGISEPVQIAAFRLSGNEETGESWGVSVAQPAVPLSEQGLRAKSITLSERDPQKLSISDLSGAVTLDCTALLIRADEAQQTANIQLDCYGVKQLFSFGPTSQPEVINAAYPYAISLSGVLGPDSAGLRSASFKLTETSGKDFTFLMFPAIIPTPVPANQGLLFKIYNWTVSTWQQIICGIKGIFGKTC